MRPLRLLPLCCAAAVVLAAGCGGDDAPRAPLKTVELVMAAPSDGATVEDERVEVRGRVVPAAAEVRVLGERVDVAQGAFATTVALDEGVNLVDVAASAAGRRPVTTAVRVVREVPVELPDLVGTDAESALDDLRALGLEAEVSKGGGLLDDLLPGDDAVCTMDPAAGTEVRRGTTIELEVAKSC